MIEINLIKFAPSQISADSMEEIEIRQTQQLKQLSRLSNIYCQVHDKVLYYIYTGREELLWPHTNAKTIITYSLAYIHVPEAYSTISYTYYYYTIPVALYIEEMQRRIIILSVITRLRICT